MRGLERFAALVGLLSLVGCTSSSDGDGSGGPGVTGGGSSGGGEPTVAGTWTGYVENFAFESGSDDVIVVIDSVASGVLTGHVDVGDLPPLAPPTDPDVGYPPGIDSTELQSSSQVPFEGFTYTLLDGEITDTRIRFGIDPHEIWKGWCELQTPVLWEPPDTWGCLENWTQMRFNGVCSQHDPATRMNVTHDCGQITLCRMMHVCACTETGCTVDPTARWQFDVKVDGDDADGSVDGAGLHNVHLVRAP